LLKERQQKIFQQSSKGKKLILGVNVGTKIIFFVGETKTGKPGKQGWGEEQFLGLSRSEPVVGNPQNLFRFAKALHQTYNLFFASIDKKLLLLKVGRPTLANCRHSLKGFQMRRSSNVTSSGAADWRRLLWIF